MAMMIKNFPLPREIRDLIYKQLLDANILESDATEPDRSCVFHTAILGVNKEIGQEAKEILYERNTFVLVTLSAGAEQDLQTTFDMKYKALKTLTRPMAALEISLVNNTGNMHAAVQTKTKRPPNMTIVLLSKYIYNFASLLQWRLLSLQSIECPSNCSLLYHSSDGISSLPYTTELASRHPHAARFFPQFTIILRDVKVDGISREMTVEKARDMLAHFLGCKAGSQKVIISSPLSLEGRGSRVQELLSYDRIWLNAMAHDVHGETIGLWNFVELLFWNEKYDQVIMTVGRALQSFLDCLLAQDNRYTLGPDIGRSIYYTCVVFSNMVNLAYLAHLKLDCRGNKESLFAPSQELWSLNNQVMRALGMDATLHQLVYEFGWLEITIKFLQEYELANEAEAVVSTLLEWQEWLVGCVPEFNEYRTSATALIERDLLVLEEFAVSIRNGHLPYGYALAHDVAIAKLKSELSISTLDATVLRSTSTGAYAWEAVSDFRGWTSLSADKAHEEMLRAQEQEQGITG